MTQPTGTYAGGSVFCFRFSESGRLERVGMPSLVTEIKDGPWKVEEWADVEVNVGLYLVDGAITCGQVNVTTVPTSEFAKTNTLGRRGGYSEINTAVWRSIPIGGLVDEAIESARHTVKRVLTDIDSDYLKQVSEAPGVAKGKPGRPSSLGADLLLNVVAPAYSAGGQRPVVAVRQALEAAGYLGSGPAGDVTIDQARKAVVKARRAGLIPKTSQGKKRTTDREKR